MLEDFKRYWHNDSDDVQFLLDFDDPESRRRHRFAAAAAIAAEIVLISVLSLIPAASPSDYSSATRIEASTRGITPLIAPPPEVLREFRLTQKEPAQSAPVTEVNLAGLLPRPGLESAPPGPPPTPSRAPGPAFTPPAPQTQEARVEAPRIELPAQGVSALPTAPPPTLDGPPSGRPKLAFEQVGPPPGVASGSRDGTALSKQPTLTVDDAVKSMSRGSGIGGPIVGDTGAFESSGVSEMLRQNQTPGRPGSALQLLSDPQGVDFRPYMTQVLAAVKRNWLAVFPESARMGQRGRTVIQFSINRTGQVPKLVIAMPAGVQALDRAAVAGVSASTPFPHLPAEFKGAEIRLQLVFTYNLPGR
jgi:TonB family protein